MKIDNESESKIKDSIIEKMFKLLREQGEELKDDESLSLEERCIGMDVLLNTMRFLKDYNENIQVLNEHIMKKQKLQKYKSFTTPEDFENK